MQKKLPKLVFTFCFLFSLVLNLSAKLTGQLSLLADSVTYQVAVVPDQTIGRPDNITNTGQITLKVSTGAFDVQDFNTITGLWHFNTIIIQPSEAPEFDYIVFNLANQIINPNYQKDIPLPLFTFKNKYGCVGTIALVENFIDPFFPPNAQSVNIGNHLTLLKYTIHNAYQGNDTSKNIIHCPNSIDLDLHLDSIKCASESAQLKIVLQNELSPFYYQVVQNGIASTVDSLNSKGDSIVIALPAGNAQLIGYNRFDRFEQSFQLLAPKPLAIHIISQQQVDCNKLALGSVELLGSGGKEKEGYQFLWSNGATGPLQSSLMVGNYTITLVDKNNCQLSKDIQIEQDPSLLFDSISIATPTCYGSADGTIEMLKLTSGTPPFQFSLDHVNFQEEHFFANLIAGEYQIMAIDHSNCVTTKRVVLDNPPKLEIHSLGVDTFLLKGQTTILDPKTSTNDPLDYFWTSNSPLSCNDCPNPMVRISNTDEFTLKVSNAFGCEATMSQIIQVLNQRPFYAPNIFSPNNDGQNDRFEIYLGPTIHYCRQLQVFNRWGQLVFNQKNDNPSQIVFWDGLIHGKPANTDTYIYKAVLELDNGLTKIVSGDIYLQK